MIRSAAAADGWSENNSGIKTLLLGLGSSIWVHLGSNYYDYTQIERMYLF